VLRFVAEVREAAAAREPSSTPFGVFLPFFFTSFPSSTSRGDPVSSGASVECIFFEFGVAASEFWSLGAGGNNPCRRRFRRRVSSCWI
jgi:hypothetical protein